MLPPPPSAPPPNVGNPLPASGHLPQMSGKGSIGHYPATDIWGRKEGVAIPTNDHDSKLAMPEIRDCPVAEPCFASLFAPRNDTHWYFVSFVFEVACSSSFTYPGATTWLPQSEI